ncbi:MAG: glutamate formimidoyltransferase [Clostridiales bacterium]|jgi:glutamate formiminotransferase|nr:glutamate formimidoyltransferase [Clostridiales bacterium]
MNQLIECVPNFSEGRDGRVADALAEQAGRVPGLLLLDATADAHHNRSVLTLAGDERAVAEAAFLLCRRAAELIDLRKHTGEHPRMGACDVIPFVPLSGAAMEDCADIARSVGQRIWEELKIPVYLYERAAAGPERANLADIRRGGFEGLAEKMRLPEGKPDFGDAPHPSAGAVAVGARAPLIAFNVNLDTRDVSVAEKIAKIIRASGGGWAGCKAIGVRLGDKVQVSMNITDYEKTPLYRVFETIRFEAARYGAAVLESEVVGLLPAKALADSAAYYMRTAGYEFGKTIEGSLSRFSKS